MSNISQYFGVDGAFAEACELYGERYTRPLPSDVLLRADQQGDGRLSFTLGYCFADVLKKRGMGITMEDLHQLAVAKITTVGPLYFIWGFEFHGTRDTERGTRNA